MLAVQSEISCDLCPYHKSENGDKKQRSWKKYRLNQCKDIKFRRVNYGHNKVAKRRIESI